jgi:hypothetical protein
VHQGRYHVGRQKTLSYKALFQTRRKIRFCRSATEKLDQNMDLLGAFEKTPVIMSQFRVMDLVKNEISVFGALYMSASVVLCGVVAVLTVSSVVLLIVEDSGSCETLAVGFM